MPHASRYRQLVLDAMSELNSRFDILREFHARDPLSTAMMPPELVARIQDPIRAAVNRAMTDIQAPGSTDSQRGMVGPLRLLLARMQAQTDDVAGDPARRAELAQGINNVTLAIARLEAANVATDYALSTDEQVGARVQALQWELADVMREDGDWRAAVNEAESPWQTWLRAAPVAVEQGLRRVARVVPRAIGWGLKELMPVLLIAAAAIALGGAAGKRTGERIL